jgi:hypothetical protein
MMTQTRQTSKLNLASRMTNGSKSKISVEDTVGVVSTSAVYTHGMEDRRARK